VGFGGLYSDHYGRLRRKNRLPEDDGLMVMDLFVHSLETPAVAVQLLKSVLCFKVKPTRMKVTFQAGFFHLICL